jgi:hypothetical protein
MLENTTAEDLAVQVYDLWNQQRFADCERAAREGLQRHPGDGRLRAFLSSCLLLEGRYRDGFREREHRPSRLTCPARQLPYPEWDGPLAGRSLLVWGEQGLGDEIQAVRFVQALRDRGAARITLACLPQNVRAFQGLGADLVVSRLGDVAIPKHDAWTPLWSLPHQLGLRLEDITGKPYLAGGRRRGGGIGLAERGSPTNPRDAERSMPEGLLQALVPEGRLLAPQGDVLDSLQALAGLDLVITVDTSWAHMAGALGVPCWVLLPFRELDWRWLRTRDDSPWYESIRLFRQPAPGDWASVIGEVRTALRER